MPKKQAAEKVDNNTLTDHQLMVKVLEHLEFIVAHLKGEKGVEKRQRKKSENKEKKPESVYFDEHKEQIAVDHPEAKGLEAFQFARVAYKALSEDEKKVYVEKAAKINADKLAQQKSKAEEPAAETAPTKIKVDVPETTVTTTTTVNTHPAAPGGAEPKAKRTITRKPKAT